MATRSLNKVMLIGNLTRDPELRYTPAGTAVCTFGLATNRAWTTQSGDTKEETEFHRIVAWNKLGELCSQLMTKGRKVYVEGRLATHSWTGQDGSQRSTTEIVIEDMILLDSKKTLKAGESVKAEEPVVVPVEEPVIPTLTDTAVAQPMQSSSMKVGTSDPPKEKKQSKKLITKNEDITPDDIPF